MSPFDDASGLPPAPAWDDAVMMAALLAVDPAGLGGILMRSWAGLARDEFVHAAAALFPGGARLRKMPLNITDDRLLGGLDLTATLAAGRPVNAHGLLSQASGGILALAMAERLTPALAGKLAACLDAAAGPAMLALDEGIGPDEAPPAALADRLAFTLADVPGDADWPSPGMIELARARLPHVSCGDAMFEQICGVAAALGVASLRAVIFAQRAARAAAALRGADAIGTADVAAAARLILAPRATRMPAPPAAQAADTNTADGQQPADMPGDDAPPEGEGEAEGTEDRVTDAAAMALPPDLLAALGAGGPRRLVRGGGHAGDAASLSRGRPLAPRRGALGGAARLSVIDTLRQAAPWQRLRTTRPGRRIAVRPEDFCIKRFKERARRVAIFAVDASGSSALNRLPEAKGAIQLLLAECYVRRDEVALIAFRGAGAETLLPPTAALARARRALASLPGGGPTPLSAGLTAALRLADAERRRGLSPFLVLLTDGGANIAADGKPGRAAAGRDALAAARRAAGQGVPCLVVDTSPRKNPFVAALAAEMRGRYLPLPYADAAALSRVVKNFGADHASLTA
jgi:magnesium chelatase subunit D